MRAIQEPWLGIGRGTDHLIAIVAITVAATAVILARSGAFRAATTAYRPADGLAAGR